MAAGLFAPSPQEEKTGKLKEAGRSVDDVEILVGHLVGEYSLVSQASLLLDTFTSYCLLSVALSLTHPLPSYRIPFGHPTHALVDEYQPSRLATRSRKQRRLRAPSSHLRDTGG